MAAGTCQQHPVTDDKPTGFELDETPKDGASCQNFPGKDYSNPACWTFSISSAPYEEMYDRSKVPRMPWHDIAMQVVGQPARDLDATLCPALELCATWAQTHSAHAFPASASRLQEEETEAAGLSGTCEVQILRSASTWSLGVSDTEFSIHTAYIKMIEDSDHFVYMENQFFITSTET